LKRCGENFPNCWFEGGVYKNVANHRGYDSPTGYVDGNSIEASYLWKGPEYYYLFVDWFWCCRGFDSTYQIVVGRSASPGGPFLDAGGLDMASMGADSEGYSSTKTPFLASGRGFIGPGHAGIYWGDGEVEMIFTNHWEASGEEGGVRTLQATVMRIDDDGWPSLDW
jgi:arabinan endo-1,5-alpha-L-arabinosidase